VQDAGGDPDDDVLTNTIEIGRSLDPCAPDTDGDGLSDSVEFEHLCMDPLDSDAVSDPDGDGFTNAREVVLVTDPCLWDVDQDGDLFPDAVDNCAIVSNSTQENNDRRLSNGPSVPGDDLSVPNGDGLGDACDDDDDNDGLPDAEDIEPLGGSGICAAFAGSSNGHASAAGGDVGYSDGTPPSWDSDGDVVPDGRECIVGTDPRVHNVAHRTACNTFAGGNADDDGDGLLNPWEVCKWGTLPSGGGSANSDGDSLSDCKEVLDVNGNSAANAADGTLIARAVAGIDPGGDMAALDINGNGAVAAADRTLLLRLINGIDPSGGNCM
jgi:hypothetical protein